MAACVDRGGLEFLGASRPGLISGSAEHEAPWAEVASDTIDRGPFTRLNGLGTAKLMLACSGRRVEMFAGHSSCSGSLELGQSGARAVAS